jgi:NAD(P)-dependent dehydrogenase (short-subunit alcohol dehydrogenase family)
MRFAGKVAIVTGAGGGLGITYAAALVREGAAVVVVDRAAASVERAAETIRAAGGSCLPIAADLTEPEQVARVMAGALEAHHRIDILHQAVLDALGRDEPRRAFERGGGRVTPSASPERFATELDAELGRWEAVREAISVYLDSSRSFAG